MQTEFFSVQIPYLPPGINSTYTNSRSTGQKILTKDARGWLLSAGYLIGVRAAALDFEIDKSQKYIVQIVWGGRGHDADAHIKIAQDAVFEKLDADDRIVRTVVVEKLEPEDGEFINIYLYRQDKAVVEVSTVSEWYEEASIGSIGGT